MKKSDFWFGFITSLLITIAFFFPLFSGKIALSVDLLVANHSAWRSNYPIPFKNPSLKDSILELYPRKNLAIEELKKGQMPYWNPYQAAGAPLLANNQSVVFYPLNLPLLIFKQITGWNLFIASQIFFSLLFTFILARSFSLSKLASLISAISYAFSSFGLHYLINGNISHTLLWLPILVYFSWSFTQGKNNSILLSPFFIASSFLAGHAQLFGYVFIVHLLCLSFFSYIKKIPIKKYLLGIFLAFLGLGLVLFKILPLIELLRESARNSADPWSAFSSDPLLLLEFVTIFIPDFFGNPVTRNQWLDFNFIEGVLYFGTLPLFFAIYAFFYIKKNKLVNFFKVLTIGSFMAATIWVAKIIFALRLPVLWTTTPLRSVTIAFFGLIILAGFGWDQFFKNIKKEKLPKLLFAFSIIYLTFLTISGFLMRFSQGKRAINFTVAFRNSIIPFSIFFIFFFLILIIRKRPKKLKFLSYKLIKTIAVLLIIFDLFYFGRKFTPFAETKYFYPPRATTDKLKQLSEQSGARYTGMSEPELDSFFRLYSIETQDTLSLRNYSSILDSFNNNQVLLKGLRLVVRADHLARQSKRLYDLLGVKYLLHGVAAGQQPWIFPYWTYKGNFPKIWESEADGYEILENKTALPRLKLYYQYQVQPRDEEAIKLLLDPAFDFHQTIILNQDPNLNPIQSNNQLDLVGQIMSREFTPNQVKAKVQAKQPAILLLNDTFYPGWQATIDNKPTIIYKANTAFRAIKIPKGEHEIIFQYQASNFKKGLQLSLLVLGVWMITIAYYLKNGSRFKKS